ncbi:MAG TPA: pentapeptide repeat-containing protein [Streptosporangiaceae bacterium]|nr:pentapeptide repeat-containing protein [Streptosporangiaceae bacterium]
MNLWNIGRRARLAVALSLGGVATLVAMTASNAAVNGPSCQPGSGKQLAGRQLSASDISSFQPGDLRCANLAGANLSGLSLQQVDFTGAILRGANLQHADLTQATLDFANLSGANLTHASMIQVSAKQATMTGADLSGVDLTQADLTGANLSKTKLSGTSFTQATLDHTTFTGATGVPPWNLYVLIAAALIFVLLVVGTVRRSARATRNAGGFAFANAAGNRSGSLLVRGLIGSLLVAVGLSLFVGGLLGEILSAAGPPVTQTCVGALCKVGVASGFIGLFGGVVVVIAGFGIRASGRSKNQPANFGPSLSSGGFSGSPFN